MTTPAGSAPPPRPRMVLRLGFAGRRALSADDEVRLGRALDRVLGSLARRLVALAPGGAAGASSGACYAPEQPPLLRLVTGLCEGADTAAVLALERLASAPPVGADATQPGLETECAALVPWALEAYRASRYGWFQAEFDRQAAACSYIVELDGSDDRPEPDTELAAARRAKGHRAQAAILLRQADLLLAAADPRLPGLAGGTMETLRAALALGRAVIFLDVGDAAIRLIPPHADPETVLALPPPSDAELDAGLDRLVEQLIAVPQPAQMRSGMRSGMPAPALLQTFFSATEPPAPDRLGVGARWRLGAWAALQRRLKGAHPGASPPAESLGNAAAAGEPAAADRAGSALPYREWYERARVLARYYRGLERGGLVLGYALAVLAVLLATLGLVVLGAAEAALPSLPRAPGQLLLLLALGQLAAVWFLTRPGQHAERQHWRELAEAFDDLAERLQALDYLALTGSFQPPARTSPGGAATPTHPGAHQGALVDWLCAALARAVGPARFARAETCRGWDGGTLSVQVVRPHPRSALALVRDHWVRDALIAAARQARLVRRVQGLGARWGGRLGRLALVLLAAQGLIIAWALAGTMPAALAPRAQAGALWLLWLGALLPAAWAALHGLCGEHQWQALAARADARLVLLAGARADFAAAWSEPSGGRWQALSSLLARIDAGASDALGAWSLDVLLAVEQLAQDGQRHDG